MDANIVQVVSGLYDLPGLEFSHKVVDGYLSNNYVLFQGSRKVFLKEHRWKAPEQVETTHVIEQFFVDHSLPAIVPLVTKESKKFFEFENKFYSLYPFVSGTHMERGSFTDEQAFETGNFLGRMHKATQQGYPPAAEDDLTIWNLETFLEKALEVRKVIVGNSHFDTAARRLLDLKIELAEKYESSVFGMEFGAPQLIHGDFHDKNIFFDTSGKISAVFDFEKAQIQPPLLELARSLQLICFNSQFTNQNYKIASFYLRGYNEVVPIHKTHFANALWYMYVRQVYSLWFFTEHYTKGNDRIDIFFEREHTTIVYLMELFDSYARRLIEAIP